MKVFKKKVIKIVECFILLYVIWDEDATTPKYGAAMW